MPCAYLPFASNEALGSGLKQALSGSSINKDF